MNQIITSFSEILNFAKSYGLPETKKRAILREYLQVKILDLIYQDKLSLNLRFVGGTCLRLLYGLDRFSEDLDFDLMKNSSTGVGKLMDKIYQQLLKENISVELYENLTPKRSYYELRFKNLLHELLISGSVDEKLTVKFDFERFWQKETTETVLLNKYGFLVNILTIPLSQILVQKLYCYPRRAQTLARDIYDIIWLISRGVKLDQKFILQNKISKDLISQAMEKFNKEKKLLPGLKAKLKPFLINEDHVKKLDFLPQVMNKDKKDKRLRL